MVIDFAIHVLFVLLKTDFMKKNHMAFYVELFSLIWCSLAHVRVLVSVRGRVSTQGELNNYRSLYFSITLFCYRIPLQLCEVQLGHL